MFKKLLGSIFGSSGTISAAEGVANVIDRFVETPDEKAAAKLLRAKLMMAPNLAQIELNKVEAGHRSVFVAGWRPFIGWICGLALAWHLFLYDLLVMVFGVSVPDFADAQGLLETILLSMLGLSAMRTAEKFGGKMIEMSAYHLIIEIFTLGLSVGAIIYAFFSNRRKDIETRFEANEAQGEDMRRRIDGLEQKMNTMPTVAMFHELSISLERLAGTVNALAAKMDGSKEILERIETTVRRHEDHLLQEPKK